MPKAVLYTDGSATILPDGTFLCGYAYVFVIDGEPVMCKAFPGIGTINQAEMCAVYAGMREAVDNNVEITEVYTDSTYVVNGLEANREKFRTNMWTNSQGSEVLNKDMWVNLISFEQQAGVKIPAVHIKGHTGQPFNELCDKLAKEAAMTQSPIVQYSNPEICAAVFNVYLPTTDEPVDLPATYDVDNPSMVVKDSWGSIVRALSSYTDDRAKCCFIAYPTMSVLASKGVAVWSAVDRDGGIPRNNVVRPVMSNSGSLLPLYRYMTEMGTPLRTMLTHSTIQWQGSSFAERLVDAINKAPGRDIYIASNNLASLKKFQGIYIGTTPVPGDDGEILRMYRSERADHGKCMIIPSAYCQALTAELSAKGAVVGLTTNTSRYCLIVTSPTGGIIISSAVIPSSFTGKDGFSVVVDKNDKISTRIVATSSVWEKVNAEMSCLVHSGELSSTIPSYGVPTMIQAQDTSPIYVTTDPDDAGLSGDVQEYTQEEHVVNSYQEPEADTSINELTRDQAIAAYFEAWNEAKCRLDLMEDLFNYIISDKFKCPEITPQKIEEIEARVRADMKDKLNSLFI